MQKIKKVILFMLLVIFCTSCANVKYELEINEDKSANFTYLIEANKEEYEKYQKKYENTLNALKLALEQNGFSVDKYIENGKVKFEAKIYLYDVEIIDEYSTLLIPATDGLPTVRYKKSIFGETIEINGKIDLTSYSESPKDLERDEIISYNLPIEFSLKTPFDVKLSNATEKNDNLLRWNLKYNQENIITAKFENVNYTLIIIMCIILFVGAQFVTIKIVKKIIKLRNKKE